MGFSIAGSTGWNLVVRGGATQLFGCGPAGALTGTTSIGLVGHRIDTGAMFRQGRTEPRELQRLTFTGSISGITLPDGAAGQLTAKVIARVRLGQKH